MRVSGIIKQHIDEAFALKAENAKEAYKENSGYNQKDKLLHDIRAKYNAKFKEALSKLKEEAYEELTNAGFTYVDTYPCRKVLTKDEVFNLYGNTSVWDTDFLREYKKNYSNQADLVDEQAQKAKKEFLFKLEIGKIAKADIDTELAKIKLRVQHKVD